MRRITLVIWLMCVACGTDPGRVQVTVDWGDIEPPAGLWISGRVLKAATDGGDPHLVAELAKPQEIGPELQLRFGDVPNGEDLALLLEVRAESSTATRVLYYGASDLFTLAANANITVDVPITMVATPSLSGLKIQEAVGPDDCTDCYVSTGEITLRFEAIDAGSVEVAEDNGFSVCAQSLTPGQAEGNVSLGVDGALWTVAGWSLDCDLAEKSDGPRSVFVRALDENGYPSETISEQVILDRVAPTGGTLYSGDSEWQSDLAGTLLFAVQDADEMWVEACHGGCAADIDALPNGLHECAASQGDLLGVNAWVEYQTKGCVGLADASVTQIRVKFRDAARNETPWYVLEITNPGLFIEESVGPVDCPECFVSTEVVTLLFDPANAVAVQVANDSSFSACSRTLVPGEAGSGATILVTGDGEWRVEGWSLDCGLEDTGDGPRTVYLRLLDSEGYPSLTLSTEITLDREAPVDGSLVAEDGAHLIQLSVVMLFGATGADEMWIEACDPDGETPGECKSLPGGLLACDPESADFVQVDSWTSFQERGCVLLKDNAVGGVRVKYRDYARNESPWEVFAFESVVALELDWVEIPGGTFDMGCSPGDDLCESREQPVHVVEVAPFLILETEVTESQFETAMGYNPSCNPGGSGSPDSPVECVTWQEASDFCVEAGGHLPTEAQWEYAARGGTTTRYYCGDDSSCLDDISWWDSNSGHKKHPVKGKLPNAYGLYDMLGNAFEWSADCFHDGYAGAPVDGSQVWGTDCLTANMISRGGGIYNGEIVMRVTYRMDLEPWVTVEYQGFRCAK